MTLVSPDQIGLNSEITSAGVNTPINQLASVINGNIDSTNISSVSGVKLQSGSTPGNVMTEEASPYLRMSESLNDFIATGGIWSKTTGLTGTMTAAVSYIAGKRVKTAAIPSHSFTANRDTYVYIDANGIVQYDPRSNGAETPSAPANHVLNFKVVSNAAEITSVHDMREKQVTPEKLDFPSLIKTASGSGAAVTGNTNSIYQYKTGMPVVTFNLENPATVVFLATCFVQSSGSGVIDIFSAIHDNGTKISNDHIFTAAASGSGGNVAIIGAASIDAGPHSIDIRNLKGGASIPFTVFPERSFITLILSSK